MISLETIGYYIDEAGSQRYPFPFGLMLPSRGNFLAMVSNIRSGAADATYGKTTRDIATRSRQGHWCVSCSA